MVRFVADYKFVTETGVIVPDFSDTREQVEAELRQSEGWADIDMSPETPQGVIATALAVERDAIARNNAQLANQISPNIASGAWLDGLCALTGVYRYRATHSILRGVILTGRPATIIPAGSIAVGGGEPWRSMSSVRLDAHGEATADFQAVTAGEIKLAAHGLEGVASSVLGWLGVDNPTAAESGKEEEKDLPLRRRRRNTLALQTRGTPEAIISALYALDGVRSLSWHENYTTAPQVVDGITIRQHALYTCIDGGDPQEIAQALLETKDLGAGFVGEEEIEVTDQYSGQVYPVSFSRPVPVEIAVRVTVRPSILDAVSDIPALSERVLAGETVSSEGLRVGQSFSPFELAAGINELEPSYTVVDVEHTQDGGTTWGTVTLDVLVNELIVVLSVTAVVV